MPMYDFICASCQNVFEELCLGADMPACPQCGSHEVQRQICAPSPPKTGAFPFKPGPVMPRVASSRPPCGGSCSVQGCGQK